VYTKSMKIGGNSQTARKQAFEQSDLRNKFFDPF